MPAELFGVTAEPFTEAFLDGMPDDTSVRYEISYGTLVVTPSPSPRHQAVITNVAYLLKGSCPRSQVVLVDVDVRFAADLVKRPDVVVVDRTLVAGARVMGIPNLVVEVHSPSTRVLDLTERQFVYAERGVPAYWRVDPDAETVTILHRRDHAYEQVAVITGDARHDASVPFPLTVEGEVVFD